MTAITVQEKDAREQTQQLKADVAEAEKMLQLHQEIMGAGLTLLEKAKALGDLMARKKVEVGHGGWSSWCRQYLPQMTQRQASNYIRISENWETVLRQYRQQGDDNLSLRGAIAYLQEAANSDHPGKEEIMRIWSEALDARFSGRRGKYPIVVDVADETFGRQFSFPKSFQTWRQTWEHWQQKGQSYTDGLTRVRQERAQATRQEETLEQATARPSLSVVPFVSPVATRMPSDDSEVQTHMTPQEDAVTGQECTAPSILLDHHGHELGKGDRVVFWNDSSLAGTITGVNWMADHKHFAVVWDGDKDWKAYRGKDLAKIPPSEEPDCDDGLDNEPQVEVQYLQQERLEPWAKICSADKLSEGKARGMFAWACYQWVCTGICSSGAKGLIWLAAQKVVPFDEWQPRETLDYEGLRDRRNKVGDFSYTGLVITHNRKKWVMTGEKIEFRPEEENGNTVSNSEPEPIFEYDDYVTGPDRTGVIRTGWVIEAGYTTMFVTDDAGKAAYDMGATRQQLENCWALDQATAEHCEPEGYSLEDDGEPAIEAEAEPVAHSGHRDADDMPIEIGLTVTPKHKPFSRYGKVTGFRSDKKTPIIVQWQTGADGFWGPQALLVVQGYAEGETDQPTEVPDAETAMPPIGTRGKHGSRPGVWVVAQHNGTSGLTLWNSAGKTVISANEFTPFEGEEPDPENLAGFANNWLNHMTDVVGTIEVIRLALAFASPNELDALRGELSTDEWDQVRSTVEAAIEVGGQVLGTGAVYSMAKKQLRQAQGEEG